MADVIQVVCPRCGLDAVTTVDQDSRSQVSTIKHGDVQTQHVHLNIRRIVRCPNDHRFALEGELTLWRRN